MNWIKDKITRAWNWTKRNIKKTIAIIAAVVIGTVYASTLIPGPEQIPEEYKLKVKKEKILHSKEIDWKIYDEEGNMIEDKGKGIKYLYISETEVPKANHKGIEEKIEKRTKNAQFFYDEEGDEWEAKFYTGQPFYKDKDKNKWYQTETAITTKDAFEKQTKVGWIEGLIGKVFATVEAPYSSAGDGYIYKYTTGTNQAAWDTTHDGTTGTAAATGTAGLHAAARITTRVYHERGFLPFDTSAIPAEGTVSEAIVYVYVTAVQNEDNDAVGYVNVLDTSQASTSTLEAADYNNCGDATDDPTEYSTAVQLENLTISDYNSFELDTLSLVKISGAASTCGGGTGWTCLGFREGHDITDEILTVSGWTSNSFSIRYSENTGTASDPYLSVTYSIPAPDVTTGAVSAIEDTEATGNGNIVAVNDTDATKRGFVYDTSSYGDPGDTAPGDSDYANYVEDTGTFGTGAFTKTITNLTEHLTYYVRAYAHNDNNFYGYGDEVSFDAGRVREADTTTADFGDGTHSNTMAITNNVELAPVSSEVDDESFEVNDGDWVDQACSGCTSECWMRGNATGSSSTGPATNHGADGSYYQFWEASSGYCYDLNDEDYIEYTLSESTLGDVDFCYHMYGSGMGTLYLDYYDGSWNNFWSIAGQQHVAESTDWTCVEGEAWGGAATKIRFRGKQTTGTSYLSDMAIDYIQVNEGSGYQASGTYTSDEIDISAMASVDDSLIDWTATLNGQTLVVETRYSTNAGVDWSAYAGASDGGIIPGLSTISSSTSQALMQYKLSLSGDEASTPQVHDITLDAMYGAVAPPTGGGGGGMMQMEW